MINFVVMWNKNKDEKYLIGHLSYDTHWTFEYDKTGFQESFSKGFRGFPEFPQIDKVYNQKFLFNTFNNRLLPEHRNLKLKEELKIELLLASEANLYTDNILVKRKDKPDGKNRH